MPDLDVSKDDCLYEFEERGMFIERMKSEGYTVLFPEPEELFLDIDSEEAYAVFKRALSIFRRDFPNTRYKEKPSKSGLPKRHVVVSMPFKVRDVDRIAWQAAFGSDPVRELVSLLRYNGKVEHPTIFLEKGDVVFTPGDFVEEGLVI